MRGAALLLSYGLELRLRLVAAHLAKIIIIVDECVAAVPPATSSRGGSWRERPSLRRQNDADAMSSEPFAFSADGGMRGAVYAIATVGEFVLAGGADG